MSIIMQKHVIKYTGKVCFHRIVGTVEKAEIIMREYSDGRFDFYMMNGTWINGTFNSGMMNNCIWENGTWNDGIFSSSIWKNGIWNGGFFDSRSTWENGIWNGGIWEDAMNIGHSGVPQKSNSEMWKKHQQIADKIYNEWNASVDEWNARVLAH